jgi:NAD(P)-dependent dehydrogenase (short-subunit alcohol dehydrogenase family)
MTTPAPLMIGATRTIGRHLVQHLLERRQPVRVLARDPAKAAALGEIEVIQGDLSKPETLAPAFQVGSSDRTRNAPPRCSSPYFSSLQTPDQHLIWLGSFHAIVATAALSQEKAKQHVSQQKGDPRLRTENGWSGRQKCVIDIVGTRIGN